MRPPAQTLADLLRTSLPLHGDRPAIRADGVETSYRQLYDLARRCLGGLRALGVRPGDRVALLMPNSLEYVAADLAIAMLGAVKVPLNELLAAGDVAYMLEHAGARVLVAHESLQKLVPPDAGARHRARGSWERSRASEARLRRTEFAPDREYAHASTVIWTGTPTTVSGGLSWAELLAIGTCDEPPKEVDPHTPALIMYTGGTTGRPKGVLHDQQALATNLLAHIICGEILEDEQMLLATPLPHSAGFHLQACLVQGGTVELHRRYDPDAVIDAVAAGRATWTFMVPTMIHRMLERLRARGLLRLTGLRTLVYGAAPITARKLEEALAALGPVLIQLYGQTEAPNYLTRLSKRDHLDTCLIGSCGRAVPTAEVRVVDDAGAVVAPGTVGEVVARTAYSLKAYYGDEAKTAEAYAGEWLRTGDLGYQNEQGHLFLVDRAKDMIISGGMNVYSTEVEGVVQAQDGVAQVMVVGLPDDDWGEAVTACVVAEADAALSEAGVLQHCRGRLAAYKVPKRVLFFDTLPLTRYGKPDKKALREQILRSAAADDACS